VKRSLSPKREKLGLMKIFENYVDNSQALSQKEATIRMLKEKLKTTNSDN
jgi:hypothetical protein